MTAPRPAPVARHVDAAKRLLDELEARAQAAVDALDSGDHGAFTEAVEERERILAELTQVVETLSHEPTLAAGGSDHGLFTEMEEAAASALETQEALVRRTREERDRLAAALNRAQRPDSVATQYAAATTAPRPATISVTG